LIRDAARVDALPQEVELGPASRVEKNDLTVDDVASGREAQLGEVARQRLATARLQVGVVTVDEGQAAEAIPLGLVRPAAVVLLRQARA